MTATFCYLNARNQRDVVLNALEAGRSLSPAQLERQFRIPAYRRVIGELRAEGYPIYTNRRKNGSTTYRLGTPRKSMIRAAYIWFDGAGLW